jgi:putative ATP-dependent endonuclease of OLD family
MTAFVGTNGAGKTTVIMALQKLFGARAEDRRLTREDIHFGPNEDPGPKRPADGAREEGTELPTRVNVDSRELEIEVELSFPELDDESQPGATPDVFRAMSCSGPGEPLKARIRLEATWTFGIDEDDISSKLYWITTTGEVPFGEHDPFKRAMAAGDRRRFEFRYLPATRDGAAIIRQALKELLAWLQESGDWETGREPMTQQWSDLQKLFDEMPAIQAVTEELGLNWGKLFDGSHVREPRLTVIAREIQRALRELSMMLGPGPDGRHRSVQELSEGQASLFYIALVVTLIRLDRRTAQTPAEGFRQVNRAKPWLTIVALEEPENHLAPFYLSRMLGLMLDLSAEFQAMCLLTTHSPGALRRLKPNQIRYVRQDTLSLCSSVCALNLPRGAADEAKFVQEAVQAHPELYFARLVLLGEGRSEEVVLPKLAKIVDAELDLDPAFVAFVPLGGRHVNHFWRLLEGMKIPYVTLLDYDLGRYNAGPLRLKYAVDQLEALGRDIPTFPRPAAGKDWVELDNDVQEQWRNWLQTENVFFSSPLDLDMMMLQAYPDAYAAISDVDSEAVGAAEEYKSAVFGKGGKGLEMYQYTSPPSALELARYDDLFKKGSKPVAHIQALNSLDDVVARADCPEPIAHILQRCRELLWPRQAAPQGTALAALPVGDQ